MLLFLKMMNSSLFLRLRASSSQVYTVIVFFQKGLACFDLRVVCFLRLTIGCVISEDVSLNIEIFPDDQSLNSAHL